MNPDGARKVRHAKKEDEYEDDEYGLCFDRLSRQSSTDETQEPTFFL